LSDLRRMRPPKADSRPSPHRCGNVTDGCTTGKRDVRCSRCIGLTHSPHTRRVPATTPRPVPVELPRHLRRARHHLDRNHRRPLDLDEVARVAGVSKYHLVRCFEATYGETPIRYLTRRRIERAQDLLRLANLTVPRC